MAEIVRLNSISITSAGTVEAKWDRIVTRSNGTIASAVPHRTAIDPSGDVDAQLAAVSDHFEADGYPRVEEADNDLIREMLRIAISHPTISDNRDHRLESMAKSIEAQIEDATKNAEAAYDLVAVDAATKVRSKAPKGTPQQQIDAEAEAAAEAARSKAKEDFVASLAPAKAEIKRLRRLKTKS